MLRILLTITPIVEGNCPTLMIHLMIHETQLLTLILLFQCWTKRCAGSIIDIIIERSTSFGARSELDKQQHDDGRVGSRDRRATQAERAASAARLGLFLFGSRSHVLHRSREQNNHMGGSALGQAVRSADARLRESHRTVARRLGGASPHRRSHLLHRSQSQAHPVGGSALAKVRRSGRAVLARLQTKIRHVP